MKTSLTKGSPSRASHLRRLAAACSFTALCAAPVHAELIGLADLHAGFARAAAALVADRTACDQRVGNSRDVCRERALAKERVTRAELVMASTGTRKSQDYLIGVKLDTAYDVARTQCNDRSGDAKRACTRQAQAMRSKGQAELKPNPHMTGAPVEKCSALAADTRAGCLAAAKPSKGGKT